MCIAIGLGIFVKKKKSQLKEVLCMGSNHVYPTSKLSTVATIRPGEGLALRN